MNKIIKKLKSFIKKIKSVRKKYSEDIEYTLCLDNAAGRLKEASKWLKGIAKEVKEK